MKGLTSILWMQIMFFLNSSFFVFVSFDIWNKSDTLSVYFLYFALIIGYRAIAIPLSAWYILKNRTKELILTAYAFAVLLGIVAMIGKDMVENPYILVHLYSIPIAFFTTMFQIGSNQMIVATLKKDQYQKFFYVTGLFRNGIEMFVPIVIGVAIYLISDVLSFLVMTLIALFSLLVSMRLPKTENCFEGKTFLDIWRQKEQEERKIVGQMHYVFIILSSFVIQYLDIAMQNYVSVIGANEMGIGFLKSGFVVLLLGVFMWKNRTGCTDKQWFVTASVVAIGVLVIDIMTDGKWMDAVVMVFIVLLMYVLHNSSLTLSFKMVDSKQPFDQFAVLMKREVVRNVAKSVVALIGFLFAIENTNTMDFKVFTTVIILFLAVAALFYSRLDRTLVNKL